MFHNISNDFMVRVSEAYGHTMLQMFGGFSDKNLSETKVLAILDNADKLPDIISTWKEGAYELDEDTSLILSTWEKNKMMKFFGNFKKGSFSVSANLVSTMLKYSKELRQLLRDNTPASVNAAKVEQATKELKVNAATIGVDKKSAKDKAVSVIVATGTRQEYTDSDGIIREVEKIAPPLTSGYATIQAYLAGTYKFSAVDANFYSQDESAQKEYADYLKANTRPSFAEMKKVSAPVTPKTFAEMKAANVPATASVKTSDHKNNATYQAAKITKKSKKEKNLVPLSPALDVPAFAPVIIPPVESASKGIPVSFCIQVKGKERQVIADNMTKAMNELADKTLERTIIHNNVERTEQKLVTRVPMGSGPNKYFFSLIQQRYIYNAKNLTTGQDIDGKALRA